MVDILSLAIAHGLLVLAFWRLVLRDDLDSVPPVDAGGQDKAGSSESSTSRA